MLKVVVYDGGMGGELFARKLRKELPVVEVIPVIDWNNSAKLLKHRLPARKAALKALKPYIGHADLIVFANHFLTITSLKYFRRHFPDQNFSGLAFPNISTYRRRKTFVLTTSAVAHTRKFHRYASHSERELIIFPLDDFPEKIDNNNINIADVRLHVSNFTKQAPSEILLLNSHLSWITTELRRIYGKNMKIRDGYYETIREICRILRIRGGVYRKS